MADLAKVTVGGQAFGMIRNAATTLSPDWGWPAVSTPLNELIRNAEGTLHEIQHPKAVIPVMLPTTAPTLPAEERCWLTCMESAAVGYPLDELRRKRPLSRLEEQAMKVFTALGAIGPWRRAVQVGTLPFSTTLRADASLRAIESALPQLREALPDRPFVIRSLYPSEPIRLPSDALVLPARIIYRFDYADGKVPKATNFHKDMRRLTRGGLQEVGEEWFDDAGLVHALELFHELYRGKHSKRNPDYTLRMLQFSRARGWLKLCGLIKPETGRLVAFAGVHGVNRLMSAPLIGYDMTVPQKVGLYRQLLAMLARQAMRKGLIDDSSSGAGEFKRLRGLLPEMEYFAVMPPLTGMRRYLDRALLRLRAGAMRDLTVERLIAEGG